VSNYQLLLVTKKHVASKVFVSTTDITTQKIAQEELQDSENRQRAILESMPVLMFAMDEKI
jgi:PAS domain-containing protein